MSCNSISDKISEYYKSIFMNSLDAILLTYPEDTRDTIFYANSAAEELFGYNQEEIYEISWGGIVDNNDSQLPVFLDELTRLKKAKAELLFVKKDGSQFPGEISCNIVDGTSDRLFSVSIVRDITERKKVENGLQKSEERYRSIIENLQDAYIRTDKEGNITMASPSTSQMYRYDSPQEMIGISALSLYRNPEERDLMLEKLKNHGKVDNYEIKALRKDGTFFWVSQNTQFHRDDNGQFTGTEAFIRDITERYTAEKEIIKNEQKLRTIFDSIPVGISILDNDRNVIEINPALERILDLSKRDIVSGKYVNRKYVRSDFTEISSEDFPSVRVSVEKKPIQDVEIGIIKEDMSTIWTNVSSIPLPFPDWKVLVTTSDITQRVSVEKDLNETLKKLVRSNEELQQFAYVASHDLREPLRMITSFLQLLERRYKDRLDEDANEFIEFAVNGAKRLDSMITDLLEYSRVANKVRDNSKVNLNEVLEKVFLNLKILIDENCAVITQDILPTIRGDEKLMIQLFQNLIGNAIKYKGEKVPSIHISVLRVANQYLFTVKDNGIGISSEHMDRIFTIFQRLHTKDEYEGTGIGLSIAQKIVHQHGGEIWVESEQGKGSKFNFTIPI